MMNDVLKPGKVFLVGTGPGDPGLFTLKGTECLKQADVVIYDYLIPGEILEWTREDCLKIYAGKMSMNHHITQDEINRLLVEHAGEGKTVVRLKGGDPFIFGRGGEEAEYVAGYGIPFEIVPGITSGYAVPAYAGIPLTHRSFASDLHFVTGHEDPGKKDSAINWEALAASTGTLVIFMGVKNLPRISGTLMKYGKPGTTPVAVIRRGTSGRQRRITGTLETISRQAAEAGITPPAIIVIGDVVTLGDTLTWFEDKPLFNKRIVVTRSRTQASTLSASLKALGADVVEFPTISIDPVINVSGIHKELKQLRKYSWIVFTSVNGVEIFFKELFSLGKDARELSPVSIAVIGKATATALEGYGIRPDLLPSSFTSEGVIREFQKRGINLEGRNILCPGSAIARDYIPINLTDMGASVQCLTLYNNELPFYAGEKIDELFKGEIDLVTFTSSSTVKNLVNILKNVNRVKYLKTLQGAAIGPVTAKTAEEEGIPLLVSAEEHTIDGLVSAILEYFKAGESS